MDRGKEQNGYGGRLRLKAGSDTSGPNLYRRNGGLGSLSPRCGFGRRQYVGRFLHLPKRFVRSAEIVRWLEE
jgi:hypothetical protein